MTAMLKSGNAKENVKAFYWSFSYLFQWLVNLQTLVTG